MHPSVSENLLVCVQTKGLSLIQLKSTRFQKSNTSQRRHYFQCPCTVCQHLWHIFYHNLYLQFCTQLKKSSLWLLKYIDAVIKTVIIQKRETKQNKTKHLNTESQLSFSLPPLLFLFLAFGISKYFTFYCSTAVTVCNKIILTLLAHSSHSVSQMIRHIVLFQIPSSWLP